VVATGLQSLTNQWFFGEQYGSTLHTFKTVVPVSCSIFYLLSS